MRDRKNRLPAFIVVTGKNLSIYLQLTLRAVDD